MRKTHPRQRPLLTLPQIILSLAVVAAISVALDLNRRAQAGRLVGVGEEPLRAEVALEETRQVELQATKAYVYSEEYVIDYARNEENNILPGEVPVVVLAIEATPEPTPAPVPTPDPGANTRPWQAWWQLLTDAPPPGR